MSFDSRHPVRFADIDRAGIVYYPRFFDYWHRAFEDFFAEEVKVPYYKLIDEQRIGFPVVHAESDFRIPLQHGDLITIRVSVARIGGKSVTMRYLTFRPGDERVAAEASITQACMDMDSFRAIAVPAALRAVFARHLDDR